jgi:hypothetical protein
MYTMDHERLLSRLVSQYLFAQLYRAYAESLASENASRLMTMQAAEKNIEERLDELNAVYHGQRQDAITSELLDIVSGVEALGDELPDIYPKMICDGSFPAGDIIVNRGIQDDGFAILSLDDHGGRTAAIQAHGKIRAVLPYSQFSQFNWNVAPSL